MHQPTFLWKNTLKKAEQVQILYFWRSYCRE
jgi:hypothetical protein